MVRIKFGTDGWRAIIAKEFTVDNVVRVTLAVSRWLKAKHKKPSVVIAYDYRFNGKIFSETVAKILANNEIKVFYCPIPTSTPALSLGVVQNKANLGVMITASHNPPEYNGYKLKGSHGGPLLEEDTKEIETLIPDDHDLIIDSLKWEEFVKKEIIIETNLEDAYVEHVHKHFNIENIKKSGFNFAFDAMYGAGQNIMRRLFPEIPLLHCEANPSFKGIPPEPLLKNLQEFSNFIAHNGKINVGLAVDGDADRIALFDSKGNYVDSHHIILLLTYYLAYYKKMTGKVVTGFSSTVKVEKLCEKYNLPVQRVRIGFKDICKVMLHEDVLVGGEESGGITIKGHIPERDGIWMGLTIWNALVESGKTLEQLIEEIYAITGKFYYSRYDLKVDETLKKAVINACKNETFTAFSGEKIIRTETLDGYKYFFNENEWLMIRPSGTEPLLRIYSEASSPERVENFIKSGLESVQNLKIK
ncbi:MAG: phosphoglucomutase/phosphomannomutase family protein [Bacteroidales bacterium]|nr:phosphoglucomutase/phosphomannomutase family protein [Bacteroidales bacterium]